MVAWCLARHLARLFYLQKTYDWLFTHALGDNPRVVDRSFDITMDDNAICEKLKLRLRACLDDIQCGWGVEEELRDQYARIDDTEDY